MTGQRIPSVGPASSAPGESAVTGKGAEAGWIRTAARRARDEVGLPGLLGGALFLGLWWEVAAWLGPSRLPTPWAVVTEFITILHHSPMIHAGGAGINGLLPHLLYSIRLTLLAGTVGILLGILVGLLMGWSRSLRLLLEPPIEAVRTVPPLAAIPFFLAWFGPGAITQFSIIVFYCGLRLVIYTIEAIRNVPHVHGEFAATLGATRWQVYRTIVLPAIVPELVGGIRVVIATSWGIDVVAELMGAEFGVGRVFAVLGTMLAATPIVASILWVTLAAVTTDILFMSLARRMTRWMPESAAAVA